MKRVGVPYTINSSREIKFSGEEKYFSFLENDPLLGRIFPKYRLENPSL
jgi:hypothetical protein